MSLRAITCKQPWAGAFFYLPAPKDIENRHWPTSYRGRLYIHAGAKTDHDAPAWAREAAANAAANIPQPAMRSQLAAGVILGYVTLWRCVSPGERRRFGRQPKSRWAVPGSNVYHWYVCNPVALDEPVSTRGYQGIWVIPDDIAAQLTGQPAS